MILYKVFSYPPLRSLPGASATIVEAIVLLTLYAIAIGLPFGRNSAPFRLQFATKLGLIAGVFQIIHLLVERFVSIPQPWDSPVTLAFMLATFLFWGYAAFRAGQLGASLVAAILAAIWSAIVSMTVAVFFGTLLELFLAPVPLESMRTWAEFQRSGWNDLQAFSIAETIDSASSHLFIGPIVACIFALFGYSAHKLKHRA
jgi:hypothetical protein